MAIRCIEEKAFEGNKVLAKFAGLSTDSKPTGAFVNGSSFVCVDDGSEFMYNETAGEWNQTKAGYSAPEP
jgi:hypothetical protein